MQPARASFPPHASRHFRYAGGGHTTQSSRRDATREAEERMTTQSEVATVEDGTAPAAPAPAFDLDAPEWYANRELSWLDFNDRVLAEARDHRNPLLERLKFLAITGSNLDEFYEKRIGWLRRMAETDRNQHTLDGMSVAEQLTEAKRRCVVMRQELDTLWAHDVRPALAAAGLEIVSYDDLKVAEQAELAQHFKRAILPILTPLVVDPAHPFPFISGASLSLAVGLRQRNGMTRFARVKVPPNRPRFLDIGEGRFVPLEEVIGAHLGLLFAGVEVVGWHLIRVLRSAEVGTPGEAAEDLRELIESQIERRRLADAVALECSSRLPALHRELLLDELELDASDVIEVDHFVDTADLMQLGRLPAEELSFAGFTPAVPSRFANAEQDGRLWETLRERDLLVHHPYESFDATVVRFVQQAARDPQVLAIKQTLYRTSPDSPILDALMDAAGKGKQVAVVVELTARFDEANNIEWARKLEEVGVHISYGTPDLKVHSKISLVVRDEAPGVRLYAHIGTGNYDSTTARLYTDIGLFTSDEAIGGDLVTVFNHLTGSSERPVTEELIVAPTMLRAEFERRIRREIEAARAGRPARLVFKMNALEDQASVRLLYEASQAGVEIDLLVRGLCRLRPGVPGLSDRIRVVSVIGRFLEHARIYYFENGGEPEYFIGSADLMMRNLDERIEIMAPVREPDLRAHLWDVLQEQLNDRRQGWRLHDQAWSRDDSCTEVGVHASLLAQAPFE